MSFQSGPKRANTINSYSAMLQIKCLLGLDRLWLVCLMRRLEMPWRSSSVSLLYFKVCSHTFYIVAHFSETYLIGRRTTYCPNLSK